MVSGVGAGGRANLGASLAGWGRRCVRLRVLSRIFHSFGCNLSTGLGAAEFKCKSSVFLESVGTVPLEPLRGHCATGKGRHPG